MVMRTREYFRHFNFLLILIIYIVLFIKGSRSEDYVVGDEQEWNSGVNYLAWSEKYNFSVGDVLVFKYSKPQHNVFEVEEKTYRSCDSSSGVLARYETGNDRIKLTEAKSYWFICDIEGHCLGGMRFGIDVKQFSPTPTSNSSDDFPASRPSQETPPPPPQASSCYLANQVWGIGIFLLAAFQLALAL